MLKRVRDFTLVPGGRYKKDGKNSGEEFRQTFLEPFFDENIEGVLTIDLDGVEGYPTAFLEEVFGGLARKYGSERARGAIRIITEDEPLLDDEIQRYIAMANQ